MSAARETEQARPASFYRLALTAILLALGALALREIPGMHQLLGNVAPLRDGLRGRALFVLAGTAWCAFGLPRQALCFAGGLAYGLGEGLTLAGVVTLTSGLCGFYWARWGARGWVMQRFGARFARLDHVLTTEPFTAVLTLRLLPVGSALILSMLSGLSAMSVWPFAVATLLGSLPQNLVFVLLGSGVAIGGGGRLAIGVALFASSGLAGILLLRRVRLARLARGG